MARLSKINSRARAAGIQCNASMRAFTEQMLRYPYLVYPTAVHTRFDHTLGVVTVASRIVRSINEKYLPPKQQDPKISHSDHMRIRLSALLHDVGQ